MPLPLLSVVPICAWELVSPLTWMRRLRSLACFFLGISISSTPLLTLAVIASVSAVQKTSKLSMLFINVFTSTSANRTALSTLRQQTMQVLMVTSAQRRT